MELAELKESWSEFHRRVEQYEAKKEQELKEKEPFLDEASVRTRLKRTVDRHFKEEAEALLRLHLSVTNPNTSRDSFETESFIY